MYKKVCCTCRVVFLLIVFHRSPALPSQLSITRVYIFFEETINMKNHKQDIHVKCSKGSFYQPWGICHVSILSYLFRYSGLCCLRLRISCNKAILWLWYKQLTPRTKHLSIHTRSKQLHWTPRMRSLQQQPVCESQWSFRYLRLWRWMAKNLSTVIAKTPQNEAKTNKLWGMAYALTTVK